MNYPTLILKQAPSTRLIIAAIWMRRGFADPDVVSIALAWNDQAIGTTPDQYIAQINYMVSQIKVACPNARVAVAPYPMASSSRSVWNATVSQYVRNVLGSFKGTPKREGSIYTFMGGSCLQIPHGVVMEAALTETC